MFESSKDILYFVISFCLVILTFFFSYLLYYFAKIFRRIDQAIEDIKERFDRLHKTVEEGINYLGIVTEAGKWFFEYLKEKKTKSKKKK